MYSRETSSGKWPYCRDKFMRNRKKIGIQTTAPIVLAFFSLCLPTLFLCGCQGGGEGPAPPVAAPQDEQPAVVAVPEVRQPLLAVPERAPQKSTPATVSPDAHWTAPEHANFVFMDEVETQQKLIANLMRFRSPDSGNNSSHFDVVSTPPLTRGTKDPQKKLPAFFTELPQHGYDGSGWPLRIHSDIDQSEMVFVPAGTFIRGKDGAGEEFGPQHAVYLGPYYIDVREVTIEDFAAYREHVSSTGGRSPQQPINQPASEARHPALGVTWRDAGLYLEYVHKQLPTEAEWEKGARGAGGFDHPWGYGRPAWHKSRTPGQISSVMEYPADTSPYGAMDMAGNAREWCSDWYSPTAYRQALMESGEVPRNPQGPKKSEPSSQRVVKGNGPNWVVWHRGSASLSDRPADVGFRGVLHLPAE